MKKLFVLFVFCLSTSMMSFAQDQTGFGTSGDVLVGYKDKVVSTLLGYDFGYRVIPSLYIGAGPMVSGSFGNGGSSFGGGGYGKVRFTVPLDYNILPVIDGRIGYSYDFNLKDGDMFYGVGFGLRFSERFLAGIYCNISKSTTISEETVITGYEKRYNRIDKKYYNVPIYGKREVKDSKNIFIPALLFSIQF